MKTLSESFSERYPKTSTICDKWVMATGTTFDWENLNKPNLSRFADWLCDNMAVSSARTYCAQLKAVINLYGDGAGMPKGWEKVLSVRNDVSEQIYLTDDELKRVIDYCPVSRNEAIVQQQFVLSALVGARHGDIIRLTEKNIRDGYVCYVSEKTHIKAQVPLSQIAWRILNGQYFHTTTAKEIEYMSYKDKVSDPTFNDVLRRICRRVDISEEITLYKRGKVVTAPKWQFASSHLGRRTCASLLYLHGCDIYSISRILAHSSVEMTAQKYIMCPIRTLSEETMGYFGQFG